MKYSEITISEVQAYLRLDDSEEEEKTLNIILAASKSFVKNYTGLDDENLDKYEDLSIAILIICAELYDNRQFTVDKNTVNPTIKMILDMYCINLL
ncbi:head-tail connector protein [Clostridium butyricum]|uniref:head-tail connector protein n=1 Tax=Clostridium butyricum TaxID=1492 RepID=UPI002ABE28F3|nr:head-tail connector protein [Clostridium butyricum]